ncbi:MAG TPA: ATP-binding protein [Nocardioidaceae bacterium]|nr:ATP-binding protein [Nocardioidaceae bacterium]
MDWLLDTRHDDATKAAVQAVGEHLLRHATDESRVPAAVAAVDSALRSAEGDLLWLHLDWSRVHPTLHQRPVGPDAAPSPDDGFGAIHASERTTLTTAATGEPTSIDLTVPREVVMNFDPDVAVLVDLDPIGDGASAATVALAAAAESHPVASPDQVAAAAGAMLADATLREEAHLKDADAAIGHFGRVHEALGGSYQRVHLDDHGFELLVDRSPFGAAVCQIPSLARLTEAIVGRLAARVHGKATVVHDESIALGDPADRLQVLFGDVEDEVCGSTYQWPPAGTRESSEPSPRLEMTVSLPRQSHSVPVIRRLAAQILRAFGVSGDSIHDVELAISEACANVIQHAIDSEGYEVSIELAADRCAITVLDRGDGFDATQVRDQADIDAESGRGLSLMRALVDNLNFVSEPKVGAVVHMVKQLHYDDSHPFRR